LGAFLRVNRWVCTVRVALQKYRQAALSHGYDVKVIEVDCPNLDVAKVGEWHGSAPPRP
jgi:hypothetical protein